MKTKLINLSKEDCSKEKAEERVVLWIPMRLVDRYREVAKNRGVDTYELMIEVLKEYV